MNLLSVMLGGAIGAGLRYGVTRLWPVSGMTVWSPILFINVVGGLAMGLVAQWLLRAGLSASASLFLMAGILGGFTTFSAFSLDAVMLFQRAGPGPALAYVLLSVGGSLIGTLIGMMAVLRWSAA